MAASEANRPWSQSSSRKADRETLRIIAVAIHDAHGRQHQRAPANRAHILEAGAEAAGVQNLDQRRMMPSVWASRSLENGTPPGPFASHDHADQQKHRQGGDGRKRPAGLLLATTLRISQRGGLQ